MVRHFKVALNAYHLGEPDAEEQIRVGLQRYSPACEAWPLYPVDSKRPVLKAMAVLPKEDQKLVVEFIQKSMMICEICR